MYQYKVMTFKIPDDIINMGNDTIFKPKSYQLAQEMESALNNAAREGWRVVTNYTIWGAIQSRNSDNVISGYSAPTSVVVILEK